MAATTTYSQLVEDVKQYAERFDHPFIAQIPRFIALAENRKRNLICLCRVDLRGVERPNVGDEFVGPFIVQIRVGSHISPFNVGPNGPMSVPDMSAHSSVHFTISSIFFVNPCKYVTCEISAEIV